MKARMCEHVETASKRKNTKKKISDSCECNAIHVVNGAYYCKKHCEQQLQKQQKQQEQQQEKKEETEPSFESENANLCGVIIKTGKKKGLPCTNSSKCGTHAHLRKNVIVATTCVE
jgi:Na+-translocating ferredoxin:NAD+ oxidoreductase RnfC subunit